MEEGLSVVFEPLPNHSGKEVLDLLAESGLEGKALTPRAIRCDITREQIDAVSDEEFTRLWKRLQSLATIAHQPKMEPTGATRSRGLSAPNADAIMAKLLGNNIGQGLVEYALMAAFVAIAVLAIVPDVAKSVALKLGVSIGLIRIVSAVIGFGILVVMVFQKRRNPDDHWDD